MGDGPETGRAANELQTSAVQLGVMHGLRAVLLVVSLFFGNLSSAQVALTVDPPAPTTADIVSIHIVGNGGAGAQVRSTGVTANGQIVIDVSSICLSVASPVNLTAIVGKFPAGSYTAVLTQSTGGCVAAVAPLVFQVQDAGAVFSPVPTTSRMAVAMMAALLVATGWLSLRNRTS